MLGSRGTDASQALADKAPLDTADAPEPSPPPGCNTGPVADVFADPVAVVVEACRVARAHHAALGFVSAEEAERFVVARICASAVVPPQVLAEASEALAGEHLPAVVPPQGVAALNKALAGKHVPAPNVQ